ncbi:MAG: hypothetical protein M1812_005004 [Candelaria pacifica]|nr:MAG: hypothetical protein M1812_005004 [Candelaria pacifica]
MEPSPLTQQARPEFFQQKVVQLYQALFSDEGDTETSDGFWQEFFLLRPDKASLRRLLADLSADDLLRFQSQSQQLFFRSVSHMTAGVAPSDEIALDVSDHSRLFARPEAYKPDLNGLDHVDATFSEFVSALDAIIKNGTSLPLRQKAIEVALSATSGAYQTGLVSYLTHRDLFSSLMKYVQDAKTDTAPFEPFTLLGLLVNYNKFEFQNPYRLRLDDFVNEAAIQKIIVSVGTTCLLARTQYIAVQDDLPEGWTISNTLAYIGLGALAPRANTASQAPNIEAARSLLAALPGPEAAVLLATYDFANANKLFCFNLLSMPAQAKQEESPFSGFLSLTSYILQHAHRSIRSSLYAYLNLITLRILFEDQVLCKRICSDDSKSTVRLCRQRQPFLPLLGGQRILVTVIVDIMVDGINHNLRRRLDVDLYVMMVGILLRSISFLSRSRIRLAYHWSELWRTLLSLIRFLTTYATDLQTLPNILILLDNLVNLIALTLSAGDAFLPSPAEYDDLFYKLVEIGDILTKFRDAYGLAARPTNSIGTLISISAHYYTLLESSAPKAKSKHLSTKEVSRVIKQGYETLSIQAKDGLDAWEKYREADERVMLKKIARVAVEDVKLLLAET